MSPLEKQVANDLADWLNTSGEKLGVPAEQCHQVYSGHVLLCSVLEERDYLRDLTARQAHQIAQLANFLKLAEDTRNAAQAHATEELTKRRALTQKLRAIEMLCAAGVEQRWPTMAALVKNIRNIIAGDE